MQRLVTECQRQEINSLANLDLASTPQHPRTMARAMLHHLRLVYFSRQDTKEAGYFETDHYGIRPRGWMRHITLAMLAHVFLAATAAQAGSEGDAETVLSWFRSPWQKSAGSWQLAPQTGPAATSHPCAEMVTMEEKASRRASALSLPTTMSFVGGAVSQETAPDVPVANYAPHELLTRPDSETLLAYQQGRVAGVEGGAGAVSVALWCRCWCRDVQWVVP
ncbi:hypothetical protein ACH46E_45385, partial [Streptomyces olivaceoviridis]